MSTDNCPFCRDNGLLNGKVIYASAQAYLIENSYFAGNFLIIPELHITEVQGLPDTWWSEVKQLIAALPDLSPDYNISLNVGALAGQTQSHLHFWVVPRTTNTVAPGKGLIGLMKLLEDGKS